MASSVENLTKDHKKNKCEENKKPESMNENRWNGKENSKRNENENIVIQVEKNAKRKWNWRSYKRLNQLTRMLANMAIDVQCGADEIAFDVLDPFIWSNHKGYRSILLYTMKKDAFPTL